MELSDLERHEVVVLAALLRYAALADNQVSADEASEIHAIAVAVGEAKYEEAAAEAAREITDREGLRARLDTIARREPKELIFGAVLDLSIRDSVDAGEGALLEMLTEAWGIEAEFETPEELAGGDDDEEG